MAERGNRGRTTETSIGTASAPRRRLVVRRGLIALAAVAAGLAVVVPDHRVSAAPTSAAANPSTEASPSSPFTPIEDIPICADPFFARSQACVVGSPTVVTVDHGDLVKLTGTPIGQLSQAIVCGDLACAYNSAIWSVFGPLTPTSFEKCPSYGGLESAGTFTREIPFAAGPCELSTSAASVLGPATYRVVNFTTGTGSAVSSAQSFLVGVRPELFRIVVVNSTPPNPTNSYAVRPGTNPTASQCIQNIQATWLPDRIVPDCVRIGMDGYVPPGTWDVIGFTTAPPGSALVRSHPTRWRPRTTTVVDSTVEVSFDLKTPSTVVLDVELSGGDDILGVNEDATLTVTARVLDDNDPGSQRLIFNPAIVSAAPGSRVLLSTPTPVPDGNGENVASGQSKVFSVPIRGLATGPVVLTAGVTVQPDWGGAFRDVSTQLPIEVQTQPPPPPPPPLDTVVCGNDVLARLTAPTQLGQTSVPVDTTTALAASEATEVIINPCTPTAEQVGVASISGLNVTLDDPLTRVHPTDAPIIAAPADGTVLNEAVAAGAGVLQVPSSAFVSTGDTVIVGAGTAAAEQGTVAGFGSIILAAPLTNAHPAGAAVIRGEVSPPPTTSTTTTTSSTTIPSSTSTSTTSTSTTSTSTSTSTSTTSTSTTTTAPVPSSTVPTIGGPTTTAPPSTTSPPVLPTPPTDPGPPPPADPSPSPGPAVGGGGGVAGTGVDPAGLPDGRLPRTGTSTWLLALVGFALLAAGGALCRTANRMTRPA